MKKVLFLITTLNGGGAERALCNITLAMPEDVQIDILVNCEEPEKDYPHRGNVISAATISQRKIRIPFPIKVFFGKCFKLLRLKKKGGYDACISFMDESNILNILTGNKYCKVIISERITLSQSKIKNYIKLFAKRLYKNSDNVVSLSEGTRDDLIENFDVPKEKTLTIYNGYDIHSIQQKSQELDYIDLEKNCCYFFSEGRLEEQKGHWHLIRAFSRVVKKHPECRLIICGKGPYMNMLKELVKERNLENYVIFQGFVKNPYAVSRNCDAFVFPSLYEGFGNVVIENMICGLPVIATDFRHGAREILAPNTDYKYQIMDDIEMAEYGIITPVCSGNKKLGKEPLEKEEELLAKAMCMLVEDKKLRMHYAEQSRTRAEDFSINKAVQQWIDII